MSILSVKKHKWAILPITLIILLFIIFFQKNILFDVISFKIRRTTSYYVFLAAVVCLPLLLLFLFDAWQQIKLSKKILLLTLSGLFVAANFATHLAFQFSAVFAGYVLLYVYLEKKIYRPNLFSLLLIAYFFINAISLAWSSNPSSGFQLIRNMTPLAFIPILFCGFKLTKREFDILLLFLFRFSIIFIFLSIASWIIQCHFLAHPVSDFLQFDKYFVAGYNTFQISYAWSNHMHPTYNALILLFSLSIGWYYLTQKDTQDKPHIIEFLYVLLGVLIVSLLAVSRFMLLAWAAVNILGLLYSFRNDKVLFRFSTLFVLIVVIASAFFMRDNVYSFIKDPVRMAHYRVAAEAIQENTWHGTGIGGMTDYIRVDNPIYDDLRPDIEYEFTHIQPHNQLIGDLMQTGIFGLVLTLGIIIILMYYIYKYRDWLILSQFFVFIFLMMIEMPLLYTNGIFLFSLIFSTLTNRIKEQEILIDFSKNKTLL